MMWREYSFAMVLSPFMGAAPFFVAIMVATQVYDDHQTASCSVAFLEHLCL